MLLGIWVKHVSKKKKRFSPVQTNMRLGVVLFALVAACAAVSPLGNFAKYLGGPRVLRLPEAGSVPVVDAANSLDALLARYFFSPHPFSFVFWGVAGGPQNQPPGAHHAACWSYQCALDVWPHAPL